MKKLASFISLLVIFAFFYSKDSIPSEIKKQRIISLAPATTEILFSLGLGDEIVGVTTFCNYPPQALDCEKVGIRFNKLLIMLVAQNLEHVSCIIIRF